MSLNKETHRYRRAYPAMYPGIILLAHPSSLFDKDKLAYLGSWTEPGVGDLRGRRSPGGGGGALRCVSPA